MAKENNVSLKDFDINKAVDEFVQCAKRTIMPFNPVAYETVLNVLELALVRDAASNEILGTTTIRNVEQADAGELDKKVLDIIDDVRDMVGEDGDSK